MSTGFTFGAKTTTPAFGQTSFGAQPSGSITFGTPVSTNPAPFGTTSQHAAGFGSAGFGAPSFGTPVATTQSTGLTFGQPAVSAPGFGFGGTPASSAPATGLSFGTPASSAPTVPGFGFGTAAPSTSGLGFGGTPGTGFSFGGTTTSASTGLTFGTPITTTTPSLGFGTTTPATGLNFGQTPASTAATGLFTAPSFSFGSTAAATTTTTPTFNLNFGATTSTAAPPSFSLTTPSTTTTAGLSFGLGTSQSGGLSFGLGGITSSLTKPTTTTTATQPLFGLGGVVQSTPKTTTTTTTKAEILPRDQTLPNELLQSVENFKNHVKQQKNYSSEVSRCSAKEFTNVANDIEQVSKVLNELEKQLENNRAVAEKLKFNTAKGLQHVEMAQRTLDTPPGLQYENTMPMLFFKELIDNFERDIQALKLQIEYTEKYVRSIEKPMPLNSQDLALGMRRLHETFVALAGRLQTVHSQVEAQKEQYLNFRKYMLNDNTNVFEKPKSASDVFNIPLTTVSYKPPAVASGPSPFNTLSHPSVIQAAVQNQSQTQNPSGSTSFGTSQTGFSTPQPLKFGNTSSLFGLSSTPQFSTSSSSNTGFQLQKPPTGNKRGKQLY